MNAATPSRKSERTARTKLIVAWPAAIIGALLATVGIFYFTLANALGGGLALSRPNAIDASSHGVAAFIVALIVAVCPPIESRSRRALIFLAVVLAEAVLFYIYCLMGILV